MERRNLCENVRHTPGVSTSSTQKCGLVSKQLYGPNSQYRQILEAVICAHLTDRTLVLPNLSPWKGDYNSKRKWSFEEVFDVRQLSEFIRVVSLSDYKVTSRYYTYPVINPFQLSGMHATCHGQATCPTLRNIPRPPPNRSPSKGIYLTHRPIAVPQ
eukprot:5096597-Pyramimonas_sp.AAC.1